MVVFSWCFCGVVGWCGSVFVVVFLWCGKMCAGFRFPHLSGMYVCMYVCMYVYV